MRGGDGVAKPSKPGAVVVPDNIDAAAVASKNKIYPLHTCEQLTKEMIDEFDELTLPPLPSYTGWTRPEHTKVNLYKLKSIDGVQVSNNIRSEEPTGCTIDQRD